MVAHAGGHRDPALAALLAALVPGAGHAYAGRPVALAWVLPLCALLLLGGHGVAAALVWGVQVLLAGGAAWESGERLRDVVSERRRGVGG